MFSNTKQHIPMLFRVIMNNHDEIQKETSGGVISFVKMRTLFTARADLRRSAESFIRKANSP